MERAYELLKNGDRSLVKLTDEKGNTIKYVVCSFFNEKLPMGSKWQWGHYFEMWNHSTEEECAKAATMYLYDVDDYQ